MKEKLPIILLVTGKPGKGKSVLSRTIKKEDAALIDTDYVVDRLKHSEEDTYIVRFIKENSKENPVAVANIVHKLDLNASIKLGIEIYKKIPFDKELIIIEGYALTNSVISEIIKQVGGKGRVWKVERLS